MASLPAESCSDRILSQAAGKLARTCHIWATITAVSSPAGVQSSPLLHALELAWDAIQERHAELPPVVMVLAAGSVGVAPGTLKLGHYAALRWSHGGEQLTSPSTGAIADGVSGLTIG